jgi:DNA-binding IclR family transcriptional regulator
MHSGWTFLTNHAHVLLALAANPDATLREVAERVGITERATHRIVGEMETSGALTKSKEGRRNHYDVNPSFPLRHALEMHCTVGQLLEMVKRR